MLDQEQRLIEIHSLLVALPALQAPGALAPLAGRGSAWRSSPSRSSTAPPAARPSSPPPTSPAPSRGCARRWACRWAAPGAPSPGWATSRPSRSTRSAPTCSAWRPAPAWSARPVRGRASACTASGPTRRSPVTDPATRDQLVTRIGGADLSAAWRLRARPRRAHALRRPRRRPGGRHLHRHQRRPPADQHHHRPRALRGHPPAGASGQLEVVAELIAWPGVLVHPGFSLAWVPGGSPGAAE